MNRTVFCKCVYEDPNSSSKNSTELADTTRYYTLAPQINCDDKFAKLSPNVNRSLAQSTQITFRQDVVEKVRHEALKEEEIFFRRTSPRSPLTTTNEMNTKSVQCGSCAKSAFKSTLSTDTKFASKSTSSMSTNFGLKSTLPTCTNLSTPLSSKTCLSSKSNCSSLGSKSIKDSPTQCKRDGPFTKISSNVSSSATRTSRKNVSKMVVEKVANRNEEVAKVMRCGQKEETSLKRPSPVSRCPCAKVEVLRKSTVRRL